ncbi:MAG: hypothetical protein KAT88_01630 [Spirochaetes bacterium]|nr:hypothetical protein [Spirochaetota bacterium]
MKTRSLLLSVFLILAVLILIGSGETKKKAYEAKENEELYGTWLNSEYYVSGDTPWPPAKIFINQMGHLIIMKMLGIKYIGGVQIPLQIAGMMRKETYGINSHVKYQLFRR